MNRIPKAGNLFLGGLRAIDQPELLDKHGVSHILSVLEYDHCDYEEFEKYKRLLIQVEDYPGEDLIAHFPRTNAFIEDAVAGGGTVLVHCAMGVSRSSTVVCAYLMYKHRMSPEEALQSIRDHRALCAPNQGFLEQLGVYHEMLTASTDGVANRIYSDWSQKRNGRPKM